MDRKDPVVKKLNFGPAASRSSKPAHQAIDAMNAAIQKATQSGVFHGGITLQKSKNKWVESPRFYVFHVVVWCMILHHKSYALYWSCLSFWWQCLFCYRYAFYGVGFIARVLARNMDFLLPQFEEEARKDSPDDIFQKETQTVLPPLPCPLSKLPLTIARSFISNALQILMDITDNRFTYNEAKPDFWPEVDTGGEIVLVGWRHPHSFITQYLYYEIKLLIPSLI